jgi:ATP-dependent phosphoenolpyruvate carboxykinase
MSTRDLIDAIATGEATEVETSFNNIMAAKVSEKLDAMRTDMAQNMFQTASQSEEEYDDFDSEVTDETETFEPEQTAEENE